MQGNPLKVQSRDRMKQDKVLMGSDFMTLLELLLEPKIGAHNWIFTYISSRHAKT